MLIYDPFGVFFWARKTTHTVLNFKFYCVLKFVKFSSFLESTRTLKSDLD